MPRTSLPLALGLAALLPTARVAANDSAMGGHGGSLVPVDESRVVMVSEDIELEYAAGEWDVTSHYVFRNETDQRVELRMGFPETHCEGEGDCVMGEGDVFEGMRTLVRGKEVPRKKGKLSKKHAWAPKLGRVWLYDVSFEPHEELAIDHTYTTPSGTDVMGWQFTTYVTRTGSLWGKPIERATFRVVLPGRARELREQTGVPRVNAERPEGPGGPLVLTYEAHDWTPTGDFFIGFNERVDWYALNPAGPLKALRCDGLFPLYLVAETEDGRDADDSDLPQDLPSLRICRNAVYAQYGRRFHDAALNQYFYGPDGFTPGGPAVLAFDPNPDFDDALLTPEDRKVLAMVVAREKALGGGHPEPLADGEREEAIAPDPETAATASAAPTAVPLTTPSNSRGQDDPEDTERRGCEGCNASASPGGAAAWLALGWLGLGRRRAPGDRR